MDSTVYVILSLILTVSVLTALWQERHHTRDMKAFMDKINGHLESGDVRIEFAELNISNIINQLDIISKMIGDGARSGTIKNGKGEEIGKWSI